MWDFTKGAIVMAGFIAQALSALLKEHDDILENARAIAGVAACRIHRREECRNQSTGERVYRWQIEFKSEEDMALFHGSLCALIDAVTGEEQ